MPARILALVLLLIAVPAQAQLRWQKGVHYNELPDGQTTGIAGRIEVAEVFSYVCHACYQASGPIEELKASLPADAALTYVHASFNTGWPIFQRAHVTAKLLGMADGRHAQLFSAIWETMEFPYIDRATRAPRQAPPTLEDFARFYARGGLVTEAAFLQKAASPEVEAGIRRAEELIRAWRVPSTPTLIVNGRYQIDNGTMKNWEEMRALVRYLVGLERTRLARK